MKISGVSVQSKLHSIQLCDMKYSHLYNILWKYYQSKYHMYVFE